MHSWNAHLKPDERQVMSALNDRVARAAHLVYVSLVHQKALLDVYMPEWLRYAVDYHRLLSLTLAYDAANQNLQEESHQEKQLPLIAAVTHLLALYPMETKYL